MQEVSGEFDALAEGPHHVPPARCDEMCVPNTLNDHDMRRTQTSQFLQFFCCQPNVLRPMPARIILVFQELEHDVEDSRSPLIPYGDHITERFAERRDCHIDGILPVEVQARETLGAGVGKQLWPPVWSQVPA